MGLCVAIALLHEGNKSFATTDLLEAQNQSYLIIQVKHELLRNHISQQSL